MQVEINARLAIRGSQFLDFFLFSISKKKSCYLAITFERR
jgi:hypothetical protein